VSPTIYKEGRFVFYFYSYDVLVAEPAHVHVGERRPRRRGDAKIWLDPIAVADAGRFSRRDIDQMLEIVAEQRQEMLEDWNDYQQRF